ncbi:MAG: flagellar protein export ATPase FliI [Nitrospirota bacterium]
MVLEKKIDRLIQYIGEIDPIKINGKVSQLVGLVIEGHGPGSAIGDICEVYPKDGGNPVQAEVVGFKEEKILLMPLGEIRGLGPGSRIAAKGRRASIRVGTEMFGRVIDGLGAPLDGKGSIWGEDEYPLYAKPPNPLQRRRIKEPLDLGIRAINGVLTCGKGQRLGIFAGSGVGKSMLLGMIARNTEADVNVIALIGERGREVNEFIERDLKEGIKRSIVIVATSDQPPLVRTRGAFIATTIAEYFRDIGMHVVLMMDSVTRFAQAQREVGLAVGEPATTKGYTPSVFALLPKLLERVGIANSDGSITGLYTVLVEGDDMNDPVPDAVRAILDGHIILSRDLAIQNHYPAIDILNSVSRVMVDIVDKQHLEDSKKIREILSTYKKAEDLLNIGAYKHGSNQKIDHAIQVIDRINSYLKQGMDERFAIKESVSDLNQVVKGGNA